MAPICKVEGCGNVVNRDGFDLCYSCWKDRDSLRKVDGSYVREKVAPAPASPSTSTDLETSGGSLSATKIGKLVGITNRRVNLVLAELGWIEKWTKGWKVTAQGEKVGGHTKTSQSGVPYVVWPESLVSNKVFRAVVAEMSGESAVGEEVRESAGGPQVASAAAPAVEDCRLRFPAKYRTADGHYVRSRAELSIDNWLYMQGIVHAYERKLPIEDDALCDFYLPDKKIYIEYWGMEKDPAYAARKAKKQRLYSEHGSISSSWGTPSWRTWMTTCLAC